MNFKSILIWQQVSDREWQAGGLESHYIIRHHASGRGHFTLYKKVDDNEEKYLASYLDVDLAKAVGQQHHSFGRM